jgi:Tfp pilus assembly protein PilN
MKAVNLIPSEQRSGLSNVTGESEGAAFMVLGTMAVLAIMALLYGMAHHQVNDRRGQAATLNARAQAAQARATQLAPYQSFVAMRDQRVKEVADLLDTRFDWAHALHEIGRVLPYDASLLSIDGTVGSTTAGGSVTTVAPSTSGSTASAGSSTVTSATPPGSTPTFTLTGCATTQSEVAKTLLRLRLIDGVSNVELQSSTKSTSDSSSSDNCQKGDPAFTITVTFDPLPAPSAATSSPSASATTASTTSSPGAAAPAGGAQ